MANVLDRAQNFSGGPVAAARQRDRWARQEANATDEETRAQYREAIADLEARYPDLEEVPIGGAEAFARERGHGRGARSPVHEGRRRRAGSKAATPPARKSPKTPAAGQGTPEPIPGITPGARRSPSQRRAAAGKPTPRLDRAARETAIPSATSSAGSFVMWALGATVAMGMFYLALTSSENPRSGMTSLDRLLTEKLPRGVGRFLNPEQDVFAPMSKEAKEHEADEAAGRPVYDESPGSDVAIAAARLKAASKLSHQPPTRAQRRRRERRPQGHPHR